MIAMMKTNLITLSCVEYRKLSPVLQQRPIHKKKMKFKKGAAGNREDGREDGFGARGPHVRVNTGASKADGSKSRSSSGAGTPEQTAASGFYVAEGPSVKG
jgi:hypothetical protein